MSVDISQIPFIDIAVEDAVREAMLKGKAAVIFDRSLENVIWANGSAAKLFGYDAISDFLTAGLTPFSTTLRQIKSVAPNAPTTPQALLLRVTAGMSSILVQGHIQIIRLASADQDVVFLHVERSDNLNDSIQLAREAISGLEADGAGAAITDENGEIIASGELFDDLSMPSDELLALCREVKSESDRLVKRLVNRGKNHLLIAAGIGRLSDNPVRNLIVAMETEIEATNEKPVPVLDSKTPLRSIEAAPPLVEISKHEAEELAFEEELLNDADHNGSDESPHMPDLAKSPVRFVWKTDKDGKFIEISDEFGAAVGKNAADIIGRSMTDVIELFELDPTGDIENSMARRDTWSGKTVLWPIEGTDLRVPVDLAALPYYDRERSFEGYRGFGILRMADAMIDPKAIGISLVHSQPNSADDDREDDALNAIEAKLVGNQKPADSDDPFAGEVPALRSSNITPLRREADREKVLPFTTRTPAPKKADGLDDREAEAFKKIGRALGKDTDGAAIAPSQSEDEPIDDLVADDWLSRLDNEAVARSVVPASDDAVEIVEQEEQASTSAGLGPDELEALPLPLLIVRGDTALYGNKSFASMSGYETISALNEHGLSGLFGDSDAKLNETVDADDRTFQIVRADGELMNARAHLQIVPWMGSKAMMFAFDPQISDGGLPDLHRDENDSGVLAGAEDLQAMAFDEVAEMRAILDTATDGIVIIGQDGAIRSINGSASALFGYGNDDVIGKSFSLLFAHESQRAAMDYLNGFSNNSVASILNEGREVLARERNGGFLPLFMTIGKLPTSNRFCAVLRDMTPWKQTEQALKNAKTEAEEASSVKSDFLAKISHEIRTPLNAIIGFSELMSEEGFGPIGNDRYKEYLVDINKSGRHVLDLVNDLLDISKIEAGEQNLEFESVILNEAVADAITMVQPQANRNRIIVRSSLESNLPSVVADARSIKQIVLNLLSNSIRYTPSGGQVVVTTNYTESGTVILRIRDTGIGMSAREIETALRPFQQVTVHEHGDGTGLGLPLTKALVEANRAEFQIASEPGRGTSVEVTFPSARVLAD